MSKNKLISAIERLETFTRKINKKINKNQLTKRAESIIKSKKILYEFLSLRKQGKNIKTLFNKRIILPKLLTTHNLIKELKEIITNRNKLNSQLENDNRKSKKEKSRTIFKFKFIKKFSISLIDFKRLKGKLLKLNLSLKRIKGLNLEIKSPIDIQKLKIDKESENIGVAVYNDHCLTLASVIINRNNKIYIKGVIEVPIPGDIIGDLCVENKKELSNIILDLLNLLKLEKSPLLIILSSSLFKINTFLSSELKQISNTDNKVQSKSPYLPNDTFVEFRNMSDKKEENKLIRSIYTSRKLIESWTDTLELLNNPIIGITPSSPNIFDILKHKIHEETSILIDIEKTSTTVLVGRNTTNLTSHKLPYGSSLYISNEDPTLSDNYFSRLLLSLELIISDYHEVLPLNIYTYGKGLDDLVKKNKSLPNKFKRLSEIKLPEYTYSPRKMQTHELISNSVDSTIETLSLITSCL